MKKIFMVAFILLIFIDVKAQIQSPVKWSYASKKIDDKEAVLFIKATIDEGWHIYSVNQVDGGPVKTSFKFAPDPNYTKVGKVMEPSPKTAFDNTFGIKVSTFEKEVIFQQRITLKGNDVTVKGSLEYMVCNEHQCLPPETISFTIPVK